MRFAQNLLPPEETFQEKNRNLKNFEILEKSSIFQIPVQTGSSNHCLFHLYHICKYHSAKYMSDCFSELYDFCCFLIILKLVFFHFARLANVRTLGNTIQKQIFHPLMRLCKFEKHLEIRKNVKGLDGWYSFLNADLILPSSISAEKLTSRDRLTLSASQSF